MSSDEEKNQDHSKLLSLLLQSSENRVNKTKNGFRYSDAIKYYSIYSYISSGKMCYNMMCNNLAIPSLSTVSRYISHRGPKIIEGDLRVQELANYLDTFNLPKVVWLSEDATGIEGRLEYDPSTNQIIGLTLPLNKYTGLPETYTYLARCEEEIKNNMGKRNKISRMIYVILAQPIKENFPPFLLMVFGTNNKFNSKEVVNRWEHTSKELNKYGIEILGISSDADPRLLNAMRYKTKLGHKTQNHENQRHEIYSNTCFNVKPTDILYIQDIVHIGTKLRNRILAVCMPMGLKLVSVTHLRMLMKTVAKKLHKLVPTDVNPEDKQNFKSLEKILQPHVSQTLKDYILDSEATVQYILLCRDVIYPFIDPNMEPVQRVYLNWRAIFFFRAWREYVSKHHILRDDFITDQTHACIEINGHSLIQLILKLKEEERPELFIPILFNSQPCESIFRMIRSMTSIYWTRINGSIRDILHIFKRVELLNDLIYLKLPECGLKLPQINKNSKMDKFELPDCNVIDEILQKAKVDAIEMAKTFGIQPSSPNLLPCKLNVISKLRPKKTEDDNLCQNQENFRDFDANYDRAIVEQQKEIEDPANDLVDEKSPFVRITVENDGHEIVRKSYYVWCLSNGTEKLSSDRLRRVQGPNVAKYNKQQEKEQLKLAACEPVLNDQLLYKAQFLQVGDWCFFKRENLPKRKNTRSVRKNVKARRSTMNDLVFGCVLAYKLGDSRRFVKTGSLQNHVCLDEKENIKVLAKWYSWRNGKLEEIAAEKSSFYLNLNSYVATSTIKPARSDENSQKLTLLMEKEVIEILLDLIH